MESVKTVMEVLAEGGRISIEVVPPHRGGDIEEILRAVELLMPRNPAFVSVTDHPGGRAWAEAEGGPARVALRTKPGTLGTAVALREAFGVRVVPHLVSSGADRLAMEDLLIDLHYAGFRDVFAVRGDERYSPQALRPRGASGGGAAAGASSAAAARRPPEQRGYARAADLVSHIASLNRGEYAPPSEGRPTAFEIGVAGYPQKHYESPNLEADAARLRDKIEAGASYVLTQMVFEAAPYAEFVARLRGLGVGVPVVPGLKPVLRASTLASIPRTFFIDLPKGLVDALSEARSPEEERAAGVAWAARLAAELVDAGAPCIHFFTMGSGAGTKAVLDALHG
jgi:methylenetetrahydrofolate reductase (NADPH)